MSEAKIPGPAAYPPPPGYGTPSAQPTGVVSAATTFGDNPYTPPPSQGSSFAIVPVANATSTAQPPTMNYPIPVHATPVQQPQPTYGWSGPNPYQQQPMMPNPYQQPGWQQPVGMVPYGMNNGSMMHVMVQQQPMMIPVYPPAPYPGAYPPGTLVRVGNNDRIAYVLLALFLGWVGGHKFYTGRIGEGIFYLLLSWTGIPGLVSIIEALVALSQNDQTFDYKHNVRVV